MKILVVVAFVAVLACCVDARKTEEKPQEMLWRDEKEVPKSCWMYYTECLSGCVLNDDRDHDEFFWCHNFCSYQRGMCDRDSVGYWDVIEEKEVSKEPTSRTDSD